MASTPRIWPALNLLVDGILISKRHSQVFELATFSNGCDFVPQSGDAISTRTSRPTPSSASNRASVFFFTIFKSSPITLTSSERTRSWCAPFNSGPSLFSWTFTMAYAKANLKSNGNKTSLCLRTFWRGNARKKYLRTRILLQVPFKHFN